MKDKLKTIIDYIKNRPIVLVIAIPILIIIISIIFTIISFNQPSDDVLEGDFDSYDEGMLDQIHDEYVNGTNFALSNRQDLSDAILDRNSLIVYNNLNEFVLMQNELETAPTKNKPEPGMPNGYYTGTIENILLNNNSEQTSVSYSFDLRITDEREYYVQVLLSNLNPLSNSMTDYYGEYYVAVLLKYRSIEDKYVLYINHYSNEYDSNIFTWLDKLNLDRNNIDIKYIELSES